MPLSARARLTLCRRVRRRVVGCVCIGLVQTIMLAIVTPEHVTTCLMLSCWPALLWYLAAQGRPAQLGPELRQMRQQWYALNDRWCGVTGTPDGPERRRECALLQDLASALRPRFAQLLADAAGLRGRAMP